MPIYTSSGLTISTQGETLAAIESAQRAEISAELDLSTSSPEGQINRISARRIRIVEEALEALYAAINPEAATGDALLRLCAITGTYRRAATKSRVVVDCIFSSGPFTFAIGSLVAHPFGRPADRFSNIESVATGAPGSYLVTFEAEVSGPLVITSDQLIIGAPVFGWVGIDGHPDATTGSAIETEAALRIRRKRDVAAPGSSSVPGIAADLSTLPGVVSAFVIENDGDSTISGQPPHTIEAVVYGPLYPTSTENDAVARTILATKAAGIGTYGTISRTIYDAEGFPHLINFSRPVVVTILPTIVLIRSADGYAGDSAVAAAIAAIVFSPGLDASWDLVVAAARTVRGVLRVSSVNLGSGAFVDITISLRQIASINSGDVTITSSIGTP